MNLMTNAPKELHIMAYAMPPIEYEGTNKPSKQTLQGGRHGARDVKQGPALQPSIPSDPCQQDDGELAPAQKRRANIPSGTLWQLSSRKNSFQHKKQDGGCGNDQN